LLTKGLIMERVLKILHFGTKNMCIGINLKRLLQLIIIISSKTEKLEDMF